MAKDYVAPESGKLPRLGSEIVERQRVAEMQVAQRVRCWTVQNEMRGVLGRMTAGTT